MPIEGMPYFPKSNALVTIDPIASRLRFFVEYVPYLPEDGSNSPFMFKAYSRQIGVDGKIIPGGPLIDMLVDDIFIGNTIDRVTSFFQKVILVECGLWYKYQDHLVVNDDSVDITKWVSWFQGFSRVVSLSVRNLDTVIANTIHIPGISAVAPPPVSPEAPIFLPDVVAGGTPASVPPNEQVHPPSVPCTVPQYGVYGLNAPCGPGQCGVNYGVNYGVHYGVNYGVHHFHHGVHHGVHHRVHHGVQSESKKRKVVSNEQYSHVLTASPNQAIPAIVLSTSVSTEALPALPSCASIAREDTFKRLITPPVGKSDEEDGGLPFMNSTFGSNFGMDEWGKL